MWQLFSYMWMIYSSLALPLNMSGYHNCTGQSFSSQGLRWWKIFSRPRAPSNKWCFVYYSIKVYSWSSSTGKNGWSQTFLHSHFYKFETREHLWGYSAWSISISLTCWRSTISYVDTTRHRILSKSSMSIFEGTQDPSSYCSQKNLEISQGYH